MFSDVEETDSTNTVFNHTNCRDVEAALLLNIIKTGACRMD